MKSKNIITINGRLYDALSGMPVTQSSNSKTSSSPKTVNQIKSQIKRGPNRTPANDIHRKPQRSQTLHRAATKRPVAKKPETPPSKPIVHRSPSISKFGSLYNKNTEISKAPTHHKKEVHPAVKKAAEELRATKPAKPAPVQSSKELKEQLIKERLAQVDTVKGSHKKEKKKLRKLFASQKKLTTVLTTSLAVLLLGGYITYINLPNISMRVAATRAGVATANFPNYKPDGYNFEGPITYSPGEVAINFKSSANQLSYTVKQKNSNWNSQAVLDNFVTKQADSYMTYQEQGLTIFSFDNKAAWVNGGILYTVEGNAKLTVEQILHIATSM